MHLTLTPTPGSTRQTLAAWETEARMALSRLRTCGRDIALVSAAASANRLGPGGERVRHRLRALSTEAARLRVELRNWDVGASQWLDRVNDRLGQLEAEIGTLPHPVLAGVEPLDVTTPTGVISVPAGRPGDQVERTVYDYLYPRPGAAPTFS
jgi:hypothetical protein